jgi:SAM-dependent methyltransferase
MAVERREWLWLIRDRAEALYDHLSPRYGASLGLCANETHREFLALLLGRMAPGSTLLSAACGAGRYDGILLEAGHAVVGIDQSAGMLARARERFPEVRYKRLGLQEIISVRLSTGLSASTRWSTYAPGIGPGF